MQIDESDELSKLIAEVKKNLTDEHNPRFKGAIIKKKVPENVYQIWKSLPKFQYNETESECETCEFEAVTEQFPGMHYLG